MGERDSEPRAGQDRGSPRRKQQPVEGERFLGGQVRNNNLSIAGGAALLALIARSEDCAMQRRVNGDYAHTSSCSCSSSRSTSPSHRNGIAWTPKLPFSRWS
jgi:hypothetical protein